MSDTTQPDTGTDDNSDSTVSVTLDVPDPAALAAELDKWKSLAQKHENRAKANAEAAKELEAVKLAALSDTEKAVEVARQQARAEVLAEVGGQLVDMAVRAAVADRGVDADALLEGLDRSRFLSDDGKADTDAIVKWVDRIAPKQAGFPDLGQGPRNSQTPLGSDPLLNSLKQSLSIR